MTRPTMRLVELEEPVTSWTCRRFIDRETGWLASERLLINQLRAILLERGFVAPQGKRKLSGNFSPC